MNLMMKNLTNEFSKPDNPDQEMREMNMAMKKNLTDEFSKPDDQDQEMRVMNLIMKKNLIDTFSKLQYWNESERWYIAYGTGMSSHNVQSTVAYGTGMSPYGTYTCRIQ